MGKNLLRNGGFERGDTEFWADAFAASFEASEVQKYKGTYSGKLTAGVIDYPWIENNDYIAIGEGEAFVFEGHCYPSNVYTLTPRIAYYDEGLVWLETRTYLPQLLGITQWTKFMDVVTGVPGAEYMLVRLIHNYQGNGTYTYYDNLSLKKIDPRTMVGTSIDIFEDQYMEGPYEWIDPHIASIGYHEGLFILSVSAKDNDTGTLNAVIQTYDRWDNEWHDIATFNEVTTVLGQQVLVVTAGLGEIIRAKITTAGTEPGFTAGIAAILKR